MRIQAYHRIYNHLPSYDLRVFPEYTLPTAWTFRQNEMKQCPPKKMEGTVKQFKIQWLF
jgi:hypothetical protein